MRVNETELFWVTSRTVSFFPEFRPAFWQKSQQLRAGAGFSMNQKSVSNLGDQLDVRLRFELAGEAQAVLDGCEKIDAHN